MKKNLLFLAALLLSFCSCSKISFQRGLYFARTDDGFLYIDFQRSDKCILFFEGGDERDGTYTIKKGKVDLLGSAVIKPGRYSHFCYFGGSLGPGIIYDDGSIKFKTQWITEKPDLDYRYLTFYKH